MHARTHKQTDTDFCHVVYLEGWFCMFYPLGKLFLVHKYDLSIDESDLNSHINSMYRFVYRSMTLSL